MIFLRIVLYSIHEHGIFVVIRGFPHSIFSYVVKVTYLI
jgi:hypothetical protein